MPFTVCRHTTAWFFLLSGSYGRASSRSVVGQCFDLLCKRHVVEKSVLLLTIFAENANTFLFVAVMALAPVMIAIQAVPLSSRSQVVPSLLNHRLAAMPYWAGPDLDPLLPLGGVSLASNAIFVSISRASPPLGTFNTPRFDMHPEQLLVYWQNKILTNFSDPNLAIFNTYYSQSMDGETWTPTDGTNVLFPNLTYTAAPIAAGLFPAPPLHLNGTVYAACAVLEPFSLYPDPYQSEGLLLLREVITPGLGLFGPIFWASNTIPTGFEQASAEAGILTLNQMDAATQADIATLSNWSVLPCGESNAGSTKCEACLNGCLEGSNIPALANVTGVPSIYHVPNGGPDMILYSSRNGVEYLSVSTRATPNAAWSVPVVTDIPDAKSYKDAGVLSDKRLFIVANSMPNIILDPLLISTSVDGYAFNHTTVLVSCSLPMFISGDQPSGCFSRYNLGYTELGAHSPDVSMIWAGKYTDLWIAFSLNTEDAPACIQCLNERIALRVQPAPYSCHCVDS